ncbi:hypothetical protein GCM10010124_06690 [Pilimelia terevasa]|uniref:Metalloprotease TldD/E C-terminal domain-containing protein n=1 Tax=Pilimelia terevasa TaxID=53372 RepID=A0A8J3BNN3_9ACTN|nr:metallopeptidase TldD-related protein [Pilimelia terevasa]GGK16742.1 hypothetical protein GCM10010124_06690 [Pilimelia terevasa]
MTQELDHATRVLAEVAATGGGEAAVAVRRTANALTRFANSVIHQNVADETTTVLLTLHAQGRTASGSTTLTTPDGLAALVARTRAAAALCPPDATWPGLAPPTPLTGSAPCDEATAGAEPAVRAAQVRAFVDAAGGLSTAGYCRTTAHVGAFANSAGQAVTGAVSEAGIDGIARLGGADAVARDAAVRVADLDGAVLGARAAGKVRALGDPVDLPPGDYEVVLEAGAVADILENFGAHGFNGKTFAERRSFAELGAAQFDPAVTMVADVAEGGLPFDSEGTPRGRLALVDAGTTAGVAHDRRSAAEVGAAANGYAVAGSSWGPFPLYLGLEPGPAGGAGPAHPAVDPAAAALVAGVARGLLVTDFWYTRILDTRSLVITGLTRNGVWLIEDGQVVRPVTNLRFTQAYPRALAPGNVRAVGGTPTRVPREWLGGWMNSPALHLAHWHFTGGAAG